MMQKCFNRARKGEGTKGRKGEGTKGRKGEGAKGRRHEGAKAIRFVHCWIASCLAMTNRYIRAFAPSCLRPFALSCLTGVALTACTNQPPVPKPYGYFKISLPMHEYHEVAAFPEFAFPASTLSEVQPVSGSISGRWFNLVYPKLNAVIYCWYLPVTTGNFRLTAEDSYQLVYKHAIKAEAIHASVFNNEDENVHAILYEIKGNVASPLQFVVTDSVRHFFRGSLLFNHTPNQDSIAPVLAWLKEDIATLINGFYWK